MTPHTLNECGCIARVYSDGSGVDIEFCPLHNAALELLEALNQIITLIETSEPTSTHPTTGAIIGRRPRAQQMIDIARAAIAKAEAAK
jgi:hypothetical protein